MLKNKVQLEKFHFIVFKTPAARFSINLSITYVLKWQRYIEATAHLVHVYE